MHAGASVVSTIAVCLLLATPPAALAARTDVILLKNGDRVTGEVVALRQAKLQVKTDDMGTVSIEWDMVAAVTTAERYEVTIHDGTRQFGRLKPGAAGFLSVVGDDGSATTVLMAEVVSFVAIKAGFFQRIDGSLDLGGSYTKSSGVAQVAFDADAQYRRPSYAFAASLSTNFTRQPDAPETSRYSLRLLYNRFRANQWLVSALGFLEGNEDLGFTFRGTGALTLGRYLRRSNRAEFLLAGGLSAGRETPVDAPWATNVDLLVATDLSVFVYDHPTMRIDLSMLVFPSLDDPGRVRVNAEAKFKRELFRDFHFSVSVYEAFDNRPKADTSAQNDVGGSVSFGWTF